MLPNLTQVDRRSRKPNEFLNGKIGISGISSSMKSPLDAPDLDYLHYFDPSDNARLNKNVNAITNIYTAKNPLDVGYGFGVAAVDAPDDTGLINALQAAQFFGAERWAIDAAIIAAGEFMYPSMTIFVIVRPKPVATPSGMIVSDYGDVANKLIYLRIGTGSTLEVSAFLRDAGGNSINAKSGATILSVNTDYLLVARMDGANKKIDLWIDGNNNAFSDTNALYDPTTTWEGKKDVQAVVTVGQLSSSFSNSYTGDIGGMFLTKTALSNADINSYASWLANKWGTVWVDV